MVRTVAVLSDIHGVLPVLDAVLAEPGVATADLIVVTEAEEAIAQVVAGSGYPLREEWADHHLRARAGDVEALVAFGPRDGRGGT